MLKDPFYADLGVGKICAGYLGIVIATPPKIKKEKKKKRGKIRLGKRRVGGMVTEKGKVNSALQLKLQFKKEADEI